MTGIIIYSYEDYGRNKWFAGECIRCAKSLNVELRLCIKEELVLFSDVIGGTKIILNNKIIEPDFAIVRTIDNILTQTLENAGIRCFNSSKVSCVCNNKFVTNSLASKIGIKTIPTILTDYSHLEEKLSFAADFFEKREMIVKTTDGHGGKQVFLCKSYDDLNINSEFTDLSDKEFCIQPKIGKKAVDMRVYMLNGEIYETVIRKSDDSFKANFTLGGRCYKGSPNTGTISAVMRIYDELAPDFAGIDFLIDDDGIYLNEIEDVVGCRMLYELGRDSIINDFLTYIKNTMLIY